MRKHVVMMMACVALCSACAGGDKTMRKEHSFTSKAELEKIEAAPTQVVPFKELPLKIEEWTLSGPLPTQLGLARRSPADEWERIVAQATSKHANLSFTEGGHCITREVTRFYLANNAWPHNALEEFITSRCGSTAYGVATAIRVMEKRAPDEVPTSEIADYLRAELAGMVDEFKDAGQAEVGLWIGQDDKRLIIAVGGATRRVEVNPVPLRVMDGKLVLEGKFLSTPGEEVSARYTEGDWGAGRCAVDTRVALPFFRLTCPLAVADAEALVEVGIARKDSVYSTLVLRQRFWPGAEPAMTWRSAKVRQILAATPPQPAGVPEQLLEQINLVRQAAGLPPHTLSAPQTVTAGKLASHLFSADQADDHELVDKICMGLLAGWDVQGQIIDGSFVVQWAGHDDISQLISSMLERPAGREVLLSKNAGVISVGSLVQDGRVGAVINVYNFLPKEEHSRRVARLQQTIDRIRQLQGGARIIRDNNFDGEAEKLAGRVARGELTMEEAGNALASAASQAWNQPVAGQYMELADLTDFSLSPTLLSATKLNVAIMVTTYKPRGYPWYVYGVVIVYPSSQAKSTKVASR